MRTYQHFLVSMSTSFKYLTLSFQCISLVDIESFRKMRFSTFEGLRFDHIPMLIVLRRFRWFVTKTFPGIYNSDNAPQCVRLWYLFKVCHPTSEVLTKIFNLQKQNLICKHATLLLVNAWIHVNNLFERPIPYFVFFLLVSIILHL